MGQQCKNINQELLLELHKYYLSEQCWASDMLIKLNGF